MSEQEEWRPVPSEPGFEASSIGRVRTITRRVAIPESWWSNAHTRIHKARVLKPSLYQHGYYMITVDSHAVNGKRVIRRRSVHTMMLEAFVGPAPSARHEGRHLDGNSRRNVLGNLAWGTKQDNADDRVRHGTAHRPQGEAHPAAKLTDEQVRALRRVYRRYGTEHIRLAKQLGITAETARHIGKGKGWPHVQ
jgi:NUMOD4 motif/HNH endonuclease